MFLPLVAGLVLSALASPIGVSQGQPSPEVQAAIRKEINAEYQEWGKARLAFDTVTYEKMLSPNFYVTLPTGKVTRKEFIAMVSTRRPGGKFLRFESQILSLAKAGDDWVAVITEKLEAEAKGKDGKVTHFYSLWVTRDGWHKEGDRWTVTYSEGIGWENWYDKKPPIPGW